MDHVSLDILELSGLDSLIFSQTRICMKIYPYLLSQMGEILK